MYIQSQKLKQGILKLLGSAGVGTDSLAHQLVANILSLCPELTPNFFSSLSPKYLTPTNNVSFFGALNMLHRVLKQQVSIAQLQRVDLTAELLCDIICPPGALLIASEVDTIAPPPRKRLFLNYSVLLIRLLIMKRLEYILAVLDTGKLHVEQRLKDDTLRLFSSKFPLKKVVYPLIRIYSELHEYYYFASLRLLSLYLKNLGQVLTSLSGCLLLLVCSSCYRSRVPELPAAAPAFLSTQTAI